ncbi:MAG: tripartite tricarboxylate transporter substrate binding protein [Burkholderiaceae bacterium]|nr:tripartite tricarboxylate transporter substrate binding protein [Burkholderiaceae bacterium]
MKHQANRRKWSQAVVSILGAGLLMSVPLAHAQDYPQKPIRIVVHYTAGGASDIMAREIAARLSPRLGQPVVIDNRPGGNGHIGIEFAARSAPDGYTLLLVGSPIVISPAMYKRLPFDSVKDFAPVTLLAKTPIVMVAARDFPAANAAEFIALAKSKPAKTYAYASASPAFQLSTEMMAAQAGISLLPVRYKGVVEGRTDVLAGRVAIMGDSVGAALPLIKSGQLKALAQLGKTRIAQLPDVPTMEESGLRGYDIQAWAGLVAPAGTPAPIINRLNAEVIRILEQQDFKDKFVSMGFYAEGSSPAALGDLIKRDIAVYKEAAKHANIEPE